MVRIIIAFLFIAFITGCTKSELEVIPGNQAPPDKTISSVTIENYITRTYLLLEENQITANLPCQRAYSPEQIWIALPVEYF
jgi:hypothetical protein